MSLQLELGGELLITSWRNYYFNDVDVAGVKQSILYL